MTRHGHLFEQITSFENLLAAARKALRGKLHRPEAAAFFFHMEQELLALQGELLRGSYRPGPYTRFWVNDPKRRRICAPALRDHVVHQAVCRALDPLFDSWQVSGSYACRQGKGHHAAVRQAQRYARQSRYVWRGDVHKFFDSVDHQVLKSLLDRKFKDARVLDLFWLIIDYPLPGLSRGKGLPIGNLTSQYFANFYLSGLDHHIEGSLRAKRYLRYMDDLALFSDSKAELHGWNAEIRAYLRDRLALELNENQSSVAPVTQGFGFLGFRVFPALIRLKGYGRTRFFRKWRSGEAAWASGTKTEHEFLQSAASLLGHIRHADTRNLRRAFFWGEGP
jgi:retron-type reverse transcriptase